MADALAGGLAAILERAEGLTASHADEDCEGESPCTGHDALRLVAAVEAVLAPHQPGRIVITGLLCRKHQSYRDFSITGPEAQTIRDCPSCGEPFVICAGCLNWTEFTDCPTRNAVAAELLVGEAKPDA